VKDRLAVGAFRLFETVIGILPRGLCRAAGDILGMSAFFLDGRRRRIALGNLEKAFGSERSPEERARIARASYRNFGRMVFDLFKLARMSDAALDRIVRLDGGEHIAAALDRGRGALVFTGHFGNWEIASFAVSRLGPLSVVARRLDSAPLEIRLRALRERFGAAVIEKTRAARAVLQVLRNNGIAAILIDQNVLRSQGVFVDFFGYPASTTPALAALALRAGCPILPVFGRPESGGNYRVVVGPPVSFEAAGRSPGDVLKLTRICTKMIETEIRHAPEQWLWAHDRWRSRPRNNSDVSP
jgi:Kdo2-lipid IVA lauroyltransferase/acyltransferase